MRTVKDLGYCGSISKSSLMSSKFFRLIQCCILLLTSASNFPVGTTHTGSLIIGLLIWLSDLVSRLMHLHEENS